MSSPDTEVISILGTGGAGDGASPRSPAPSLPEILPILGLSDIVIFPGMNVPLVVESTPSIKLVDDAVAGERMVGLILQRKPDTVDPKPEDLYEYGCVARIQRMLKFPDNTMRILIDALWRFRVVEYLGRDPYLKARVEVLRDDVKNSIELAALARNANTRFQEIIVLSPALAEQVKVAALNTEEPGKLSDLIAANLNLSLDDRQGLLEVANVQDRLTKLLPLMNREHELLTLGSKIQKEVATSMTKNQRDFFLREQMRAIQKELGEDEGQRAQLDDWKARISAANMPEDAREVALKELSRLEQIPPSSAEFVVSRNYLDWLTSLPWSVSSEDKLDLEVASKILDEQHFGLDKVKERLLEFLAVIKLRKQLKGPILCLVGPPGVGKTSLGRSIAEALGRKFIRIALGGMRDEAEIRGHRRTYVGALPGRIIQSLRRAETNNPVILLDEIDKVGSDFRGDPASALLEVLDPHQNSTFTDNYLDLPFDLSRVLFLTTANWLEPVQPALRDRLEIIELPSYTATEKLQIAKLHLLPKQLDEHGVKRKLVKIPDATLRKLISGYTREAGVRNLDRELASLVRKAARKIVTAGGDASPIVIKPDELSDFLGMARFHSEEAETITETGIAIGLAWTPVGGEILFIEATRMPGAGRLILTGSLGEVMKESAQTALSYLRSHAALLQLDMTDYDKSDIHVHVPSGATPKDGPSAGVALAVALASLLSRRLAKSEFAMTGEVSLRGRVMPVGGIKEKVLAASRSGIKQLILPRENEKDWLEVPLEVRERMKVHFVKHLSEVLPLALKSK